MLSNHHNRVQYLLNRELTEIYITHALRHFAISMVGIFVPLYFLNAGLAFHHVVLYYVLHSLVQICLFVFGSRLVCSLGVKHSILISQPLLISFFIGMHFFSTLKENLHPLALVAGYALIFASAMFFYWLPFHLDFAAFSKGKSEGRQIGVLQAISMFFGVFGPLAGAMIITTFSYGILFWVSAILLLLGTLPLFLSKDLKLAYAYHPKQLIGYGNWKNKSIYLAEGARQISALVFWPVFLFFISIKISSLGLLYSLTNLLLAIFSIVVGRISDSVNKNFLMRLGAIVHAISLTARTLFRSLFLIFSVQSIGAMSFPLLEIPYASIIYNEARKKGLALFIINQQIFFNLGRLFAGILCLSLFFSTGRTETALFFAIFVGSLSAILMSYITEERLDELESPVEKQKKKQKNKPTGH
ncbi:MAG: hypothetical protein ACOC32_01925 [Nanoarchaeota archaeon]